MKCPQWLDYRYTVLGGLAAAWGLAAFYWRGSNWFVDNYGANLSATFIGTLLLLILIDRTLERRSREEARRKAGVAIRQMRVVLNRMFSLLGGMIKAASAAPIPEPRTLADAFAPELLSNLDHLDLEGPSSGARKDWIDYAASEISRDLEDLRRIGDTYFEYIPFEVTTAINALQDNPFLGMLRTLSAARVQLRSQNVWYKPGLMGVQEHCDAAIDSLLTLATHYEQIIGEALPVPEVMYRPDIYPPAGSGRLADTSNVQHPIAAAQAPRIGPSA